MIYFKRVAGNRPDISSTQRTKRHRPARIALISLRCIQTAACACSL